MESNCTVRPTHVGEPEAQSADAAYAAVAPSDLRCLDVPAVQRALAGHAMTIPGMKRCAALPLLESPADVRWLVDEA